MAQLIIGQVAEQYSATIHLLLTDVVMPKMNGLELGRQLTAHHPALRKCFMFGYIANVIASHGLLHEGLHFLAKSFSRQDLAATVRRVLYEPQSNKKVP